MKSTLVLTLIMSCLVPPIGARASLVVVVPHTIDSTVTVVAVDRAGNESEPSDPVRVTHAGVMVDPQLSAAIDTIAASALERGPIAGLSVAVLRGRQHVHVRGYGFASLADSVRAGPHTVYDIASITKLFTALSILGAVDAGQLSLDDPLIKHLPEFPNPEQGAKITIRHLLNHTSGLHDYEDADTERWLEEGTPLTREFMYDFLRGRPLDFEPGSQWSYCNTGFYLAALVIERLTRKPYATCISDLTGIRSLDLSETGVCSDGSWRPRATGYDAGDGHLAAGRLYMVPGIIGDGGMCSSAFELVRLPGILSSVRVLSGPALDEMKAPTRLANGITVDYGLGVRLGSLEGHRLWGHTGGMGTYWSVLAHYPDDDLTIVVLVNTDNAAEDALTIEGAIARVALGLGAAKLKDLRVPTEDARTLSGTYEDGSSRVRVLRSREDLLRAVEGSEAEPSPLLYQGQGAFGWASYPMDRMVFHVRNGRVVGISEYHNGMFATYRRAVGKR